MGERYIEYKVPVGVTRVYRRLDGSIRDIEVGRIVEKKGLTVGDVTGVYNDLLAGDKVRWDDAYSKMHDRVHGIDSLDDHGVVGVSDRVKLVVTDGSNGAIGFMAMSTLLNGYATQQWVQQQGYLTTQHWSRDSVNGYLYPAVLTDKVGIGTNAPIKNIDIVGLQAAIRLKSSQNINEASLIAYNDITNYITIGLFGSSRSGAAISGVNNANLSFLTSFTSNMLIHASSGDLIIANSGVESFRIKANNTWLFKGGVTKLEFTPGNIPVFNSRLIVGDYSGTDYAPTSMLSVSSGFSYTSTKDTGIDIFGNRSYPSGTTFGIKVRGTSTLSVNQSMIGFYSALAVNQSFPGGSIYDYYCGSSFSPLSQNGTYYAVFISPVINQTGTSSGRTVGLLIEPGLISAVNWRSIEWNNASGYGLYGAGTAKNYLNGQLGIKTDTPTRTADINGNLRVRTLADGSGAAYTKLLVADADGNVDAIDKSDLSLSTHTHSSVSGTFTTVNGMTITITNGIVTNITGG